MVDPNQIRYTLRQLTVSQLAKAVNNGTLVIRPSDRITCASVSSVVEASLLQIELPPVVFETQYESQDTDVSVSDAHNFQALWAFAEGGFPLQGMRAFPELNGLTFTGLPARLQNRIQKTYLRLLCMDPMTSPTREVALELAKAVF